MTLLTDTVRGTRYDALWRVSMIDADRDEATLDEIIRQLRDFDALINLVGMMEHYANFIEVEYQNEFDKRLGKRLQPVTDIEVRVYHLSRNSPLEIIFAITAGGGAMTGLGYGLLRLHDRFQQSRLTTARTSAQVRAYKYLQNEIERTELHHQSRTVHDANIDFKPNKRAAARALERLISVDQVPPSAMS